MEHDKVMIGTLGTAVGMGIVIGWKAGRRHTVKKVRHAFEVAGLQGQLLAYILKTLSDEDFDPQQFENTVNENIRFIEAVAKM